MGSLYLILYNLNALFSLAIFIIAILEFIDYEYPNRKKVKATIDKHLDPLLKKFNIKLE
ncbi:hypothetical protein VAMP_379n55, partial [Candidatus Vampirococcus lugosii]|nr:hypothetical protein [Candidatus Vampirococcus lugosii]